MSRFGGWILLTVSLGACVTARVMLHRSLEGSLEWGWSEAAASLRVSAVLSAVSAGAALAMAGMLLQGMLRNPLASPFVLGLGGGAQAAVAVATLVAWRAGGAVGTAGELAVASVGAAVALITCMAFGRSRERGLDPVSLVLAGVVVAAIAGSLATLCEWLLPPSERAGLLAWGLGRIPESPDRSMLVGRGREKIVKLAGDRLEAIWKEAGLPILPRWFTPVARDAFGRPIGDEAVMVGAGE